MQSANDVFPALGIPAISSVLISGFFSDLYSIEINRHSVRYELSSEYHYYISQIIYSGKQYRQVECSRLIG